MSVQRIYESPRVTKPYTERAMAGDRGARPSGRCRSARGRRAPHHGRRADLRFHRRSDGAEWTTSAFGPNKRKLSVDLFLKLRDRFAPGACCISDRANGIPASRCRAGRWAVTGAKTASRSGKIQSLIADDRQGLQVQRRGCAPVPRSPDAPARSGRFVHHDRLRRRLLLPVEGAQAAGERRSARFQTGRSHRARARWPHFRTGPRQDRRLRASAAPDSDASGTPRWTSQPWFLASQRLFLVPGDSPMGYRLPLESLPWTKPEDVGMEFRSRPVPSSATSCPTSPRASAHLFTRAQCHADRSEPRRSRHAAKPPEKGESAPWVSRPALCVQVREGKLYVFMPPVEYLADYLDLVAAIEDTAAYLRMPVTIEGYTPPYDPRISVLKVTPDPGVIEVNVHPPSSWDELVEQHHRSLRTGAPIAPGHREIHARRAALRHRRRQSRRDRRGDSGRQPVPAPSRSAAQPGRLLAESSVAVVSVFGTCSSAPPASIRASMKRARIPSTSWKSRSARCPTRAKSPSRRGWSTAFSAIC